MVVTSHPAATEGALEILRSGGNAVDGAIVAQWILNVVEPQSSGIGGGGFFLYYDAKNKSVHTFDGREKAPIRAPPEMFLDESGDPLPSYPDQMTGGLAVGVPGTLRLLKEVHRRFGSEKYRFEELFIPAIRLAEGGAPVSKSLAEAIQKEEARLKLFKASREIFFHPNGEPFKEGEILYQPDLAKTFETIRRKGVGAFYEGEIARAIAKAVAEDSIRPGFLQRFDLQFYKVIEREPIHGTYRGYDIFSVGPPSSGGVALIQTLNILENFSLVFYGASADSFHLAIEAQKIAFEDREEFIGDPDFVQIPLERLLSKDDAKKKAEKIKFDEARQPESLMEETTLSSQGNTSHISIWDSGGNIVSYTTTIEHVFGSALVVPEWGFVLNNELTDFDAVPRVPYKIASALAPQGSLLHSAMPTRMKAKLKPNAPEPEKRPRSSMCPIIVFRSSQPVLVAGSPGGSLIIPTVQGLLMCYVDFRLPPEDVLAAPRFAARGSPVEAEGVFLEDTETINSLRLRGHTFKSRPDFGNAQVIFYDPKTNLLTGVSDPRGIGEAQGY